LRVGHDAMDAALANVDQICGNGPVPAADLRSSVDMHPGMASALGCHRHQAAVVFRDQIPAVLGGCCAYGRAKEFRRDERSNVRRSDRKRPA
jgi:hypothetical protein